MRPGRDQRSGAVSRKAWIASFAIDLFSRPSFLYCAIGAAVLFFAKHKWNVSDAETSLAETNLSISLVLGDIAFLASAAAISMLLENLWSKLKIATALTCMVFAVVCYLNMIWIGSMGGQIAWSVIAVAMDNTSQNFSVAMDVVTSQQIVGFFVLVLAPLAAPLLALFVRRRIPSIPTVKWFSAAVPSAAAIAAFAGLLFLSTPDASGGQAMSNSAHVDMLKQIFSANKKKSLTRARLPNVYPERVKERESLKNVIVIFLESCSFRYSSFGDPESNRTPFLKELASKGLTASNMRIVMPHTTKSMFSALCGQYPSMQNALVEFGDNFPMKCLPEILGDLGYFSAFFQSANGEFEGRPRLVDRMGFNDFFARQTLNMEKLSYINGDDFGLIDPAVEWIQKHPGRFMLTMLTSLTHVPYLLPQRFEQSTCTNNGAKCRLVRYKKAYSATDEFIKQLFGKLGEIGVIDDTIVIVTGDHGEGFGEHGKLSHDNVYFDEGVKVPYVVWAPGLVNPGTDIREPRSMVDTFPTILSMIGVPYDAASVAGLSLLEKQHPELKRHFACWYDEQCYGYVQGSKKTIYLPQVEKVVTFDLEKDALELNPQIQPSNAAKESKELRAWIESRQNIVAGRIFEGKDLYQAWKCQDETNGNCAFDPNAYTENLLKVAKVKEDEGLTGTYYSGRNFQGNKRERLDHIIDFRWAKRAPMAGMPRDNFSVRWDGCLFVDKDESPVVAAGSDDGILVFVDGKLYIDDGNSHAFRISKAEKPLESGLHRISLEYTELSGNAIAFLGWSLKGENPKPIPPARLVPVNGNSRHPCAFAAPVTGFGLTATYFKQKGFQGENIERIDRTVDFDWGLKEPMAELPKDNFSVRWEGCIVAGNGGSPTIMVRANDEIEVFVDGVSSVKGTGEYAYQTQKAVEPLSPGVHTIRVDFTENDGRASAFVGWSLKNGPASPISPTQLIPMGGNERYECPPKKAAATSKSKRPNNAD